MDDIERIEQDMIEFYQKSRGFAEYVDRAMFTYRKPFLDIMKDRIVREYYLSMQKGGCNEERADGATDN